MSRWRGSTFLASARQETRRARRGQGHSEQRRAQGRAQRARREQASWRKAPPLPRAMGRTRLPARAAQKNCAIPRQRHARAQATTHPPPSRKSSRTRSSARRQTPSQNRTPPPSWRRPARWRGGRGRGAEGVAVSAAVRLAPCPPSARAAKPAAATTATRTLCSLASASFNSFFDTGFRPGCSTSTTWRGAERHRASAGEWLGQGEARARGDDAEGKVPALATHHLPPRQQRISRQLARPDRHALHGEFVRRCAAYMRHDRGARQLGHAARAKKSAKIPKRENMQCVHCFQPRTCSPRHCRRAFLPPLLRGAFHLPAPPRCSAARAPLRQQFRLDAAAVARRALCPRAASSREHLCAARPARRVCPTL